MKEKREILKEGENVFEWRVFAFSNGDIVGRIFFGRHYFPHSQTGVFGDCCLLYKDESRRWHREYLLHNNFPDEIMKVDLYDPKKAIKLMYEDANKIFNCSLEYRRIQNITFLPKRETENLLWRSPLPFADVVGEVRIDDYQTPFRGIGFIGNNLISYPTKLFLQNIFDSSFWYWHFFSSKRIGVVLILGMVQSSSFLVTKIDRRLFIFNSHQFAVSFSWGNECSYPEKSIIKAFNEEVEIEIINQKKYREPLPHKYSPYFHFIDVGGSVK
ncbi:MAG: hypothetical protein NC820_06020, partial [Candidatus Omnitrophica bacterium]|nr:hypothetical protein [Candidatus Omnitrophota bacterium]